MGSGPDRSLERLADEILLLTNCFTIIGRWERLEATRGRQGLIIGRKDYFLGNHPLWQVFRVSFQMMKKPYVLGGLALLSGYFYSFASRMERPVAAELLKFHRQEQLETA